MRDMNLSVILVGCSNPFPLLNKMIHEQKSKFEQERDDVIVALNFVDQEKAANLGKE